MLTSTGLLLAVLAAVALGGCTGNVATGPGGGGSDPTRYAVLVTNGWINEWVWVRDIDGDVATIPSWPVVGVNLHRLRPGEHDITYQFQRGKADAELPVEAATVNLAGGKTYRVRPTFKSGEEWVEFGAEGMPTTVTADTIKYELVEIDPDDVRDICERTGVGVRCGLSLGVRP